MRIEPQRTLLRLAHLFSVFCFEKRACERVCILSRNAAYKVGTRQNIAPLIVAADLERATVILVQPQKIVRLHGHVVKFQKAQTFFQTRLKAIRSEHFVYGKIRAVVAQKIYIVEFAKPIGVIYEQSAVLAVETDEPFELRTYLSDIVGYRFFCHHLAHVVAVGRITDHRRAAADEQNGLVPRLLHYGRYHERNNVPDMQTVRRRIESAIKRHRALSEHFVQIVLIHGLFDISSAFEYVVYVFFHVCLLAVSAPHVYFIVNMLYRRPRRP